MSIENYFNKTEGITSLTDKFDYIKNHFTYWTMNSWNRLESIANNVKIHSLGLTSEQQHRVYELMDADQEEFYFLLNLLIEDGDLKVGFNGRSGGYLVLYNNDNYRCAIDDCYYEYNNYKEYIKDKAEEYGDYRNAQYDCKCTIERDFEVVKQFDELCDMLRAEVIYMADNAKIEEEEYTVTKVRKNLVFED